MRETAAVKDADEVERLEAALRESGWADHTSISRELRAWCLLSEEVSTYAATVDDYTNDLSSRDYLAQAIAEAAPELRREIDDQLAAADERFRASTVEDDEGRLGRYFAIRPDDGWWWRRRPSTGPLADYLARDGRTVP